MLFQKIKENFDILLVSMTKLDELFRLDRYQNEGERWYCLNPSWNYNTVPYVYEDIPHENLNEYLFNKAIESIYIHSK